METEKYFGSLVWKNLLIWLIFKKERYIERKNIPKYALSFLYIFSMGWKNLKQNENVVIWGFFFALISILEYFCLKTFENILLPADLVSMKIIVSHSIMSWLVYFEQKTFTKFKFFRRIAIFGTKISFELKSFERNNMKSSDTIQNEIMNYYFSWYSRSWFISSDKKEKRI